MGERKVLNKYYPPDFNPAKIPRRRQPKNRQQKVRMMLPMSVRCNTCGNYMYQGTKFNSRIEHADNYLGIKIFRFYSKCTNCSAEVTYKTDPKNSDYAVESGATRNFEPWREQDEEREKQKRKRDAEETGDAMKSLENRALDSKREMDIVSTLDELKSMKSRQATVSVEAMLEALRHIAEEKERKMQEESNALIKSLFEEKRDKFVRRIREDEDEDDDEDLDIPQKSRESSISFLKRRKLLYMNPRDVLTKSSDIDKAVGKGEVKVVVVKKKSLPSSSKEIAEKEKLDVEEEEEEEEEEEPTSLKKVDITERANLDRIRYGLVEAACQETTESLSSFEESVSCVDDSNLCDDATSSLEFSDVSGFFGLRKKVTPQWRGFVRPLMWRCKWTELQLVKFKSLAQKYDKELAQYSASKQTEFMNFEPEVINSRSIPFSFTPRKNVVFERKRRRRYEESQDIAEYMSKHCLFSFNENRKLAADGGLWNDNQFNSALVSSEELKGGGCFDEGEEEPPLKCLRRMDRNDPMEQLLRKIGTLQSRVSRCKSSVEKIMSENGGKLHADDEPNLKKMTDLPPTAENRNGMTERRPPPPPPPHSIAAQLLAAQSFPCSDNVLDNGECVTELTNDSRVVGTRVNNEEVFMIYDHRVKERMRSFQEAEMIECKETLPLHNKGYGQKTL